MHASLSNIDHVENLADVIRDTSQCGTASGRRRERCRHVPSPANIAKIYSAPRLRDPRFRFHARNLDHAEVAVEEAPVLRVLSALDVVAHGQQHVPRRRVVEVEHVLQTEMK